jgi:hypothetical protein
VYILCRFVELERIDQALNLFSTRLDCSDNGRQGKRRGTASQLLQPMRVVFLTLRGVKRTSDVSSGGEEV